MKSASDAVFGPMAMVKINGSQIKRLRESQGLTQLYVATAVGVTTDTVSRWENGRYPNIKRENGVRLAETLEVVLGDILLDEEDGSKQNHLQAAQSEEVEKTPSALEIQQSENPQIENIRKRNIAFLLVALLVALLIAWALKDLFPVSEEEVLYPPIAVRIAPHSALPNQRVPVVIIVERAGNETPAAVILRERLPHHALAYVSQKEISPPPAQVDLQLVSEIKWLAQVEHRGVFTYILNTAGNAGEAVDLDGTISSRGESGQRITGCKRIVIGQYHWADENRDGVIDDREIILVYDRFSTVNGFSKEIDDVERIWLGRGYRWDAETGKISIVKQKNGGSDEKNGVQ